MCVFFVPLLVSPPARILLLHTVTCKDTDIIESIPQWLDSGWNGMDLIYIVACRVRAPMLASTMLSTSEPPWWWRMVVLENEGRDARFGGK